MALNIAVPLSGLGGLSPISPIGIDCWENIKILVSPIGSESSGVSSLDSEEAKQLRPTALSPPKKPTAIKHDIKIYFDGRDILDLNSNMEINSPNWKFRYSHLPERNNIAMYWANRSVYTRLGPNGLTPVYTINKCECCDFQYTSDCPNPYLTKASLNFSSTTTSAMTFTTACTTQKNQQYILSSSSMPNHQQLMQPQQYQQQHNHHHNHHHHHHNHSQQQPPPPQSQNSSSAVGFNNYNFNNSQNVDLLQPIKCAANQNLTKYKQQNDVFLKKTSTLHNQCTSNNLNSVLNVPSQKVTNEISPLVSALSAINNLSSNQNNLFNHCKVSPPQMSHFKNNGNAFFNKNSDQISTNNTRYNNVSQNVITSLALTNEEIVSNASSFTTATNTNQQTSFPSQNFNCNKSQNQLGNNFFSLFNNSPPTSAFSNTSNGNGSGVSNVCGANQEAYAGNPFNSIAINSNAMNVGGVNAGTTSNNNNNNSLAGNGQFYGRMYKYF